MNTPAKTCPACGNNLSRAHDVKPGVCPNCGRRMALGRKHPLDAGECVQLAFGASMFLGLAGGLLVNQAFVGLFLGALFLGTPHLFPGFFSAGFFSRTIKAQLLWGTALSFAYVLASVGMIYVGCRRLLPA